VAAVAVRHARLARVPRGLDGPSGRRAASRAGAPVSQISLDLSDRLELLELGARCAQAFDSGDGRAWAALFVPDGVFVRPDGREVVGTDALAGVPPESTTRVPGMRHFPNGTVLDEREGVVHGRSYVRAYRAFAHNELTLITAGEYHDTFVCADGVWKLCAARSCPGPSQA
jgi:hypothetical protein